MSFSAELFKKTASKKAPKLRFRLSAGANRKIGKISEDFFLRGGLMTRLELRRSQFFPPDFKAYLRKLERESCAKASEYHRGLADGLNGVGKDSPKDQSDNATEIYFLTAMFWRTVAKFSSVTEYHSWLQLMLGSPKVRVEDRERIAKICQRIGLRFRKRGRPKNKTVVS
jgi:hypothetical protein